jgi:hypothetical protein
MLNTKSELFVRLAMHGVAPMLPSLPSTVAWELQRPCLRAALPVLVGDLALDLKNAIDDGLRWRCARRMHLA